MNKAIKEVVAALAETHPELAAELVRETAATDESTADHKIKPDKFKIAAGNAKYALEHIKNDRYADALMSMGIVLEEYAFVMKDYLGDRRTAKDLFNAAESFFDHSNDWD